MSDTCVKLRQIHSDGSRETLGNFTNWNNALRMLEAWGFRLVEFEEDKSKPNHFDVAATRAGSLDIFTIEPSRVW